MHYRLYRPGTADASRLDVLLNGNAQGDVQLGLDRIVVAVAGGDVPSGCLVWRPCAFVHEFLVPPSLGQNGVARAMMDAAVRFDVGRRHLIRHAVFMVDSSNHRMLRYVRDDLHAVEQSGTVFLLPLPLPLKAPGDVHESV